MRGRETLEASMDIADLIEQGLNAAHLLVKINWNSEFRVLNAIKILGSHS